LAKRLNRNGFTKNVSFARFTWPNGTLGTFTNRHVIQYHTSRPRWRTHGIVVNRWVTRRAIRDPLIRTNIRRNENVRTIFKYFFETIMVPSCSHVATTVEIIGTNRSCCRTTFDLNWTNREKSRTFFCSVLGDVTPNSSRTPNGQWICAFRSWRTMVTYISPGPSL